MVNSNLTAYSLFVEPYKKGWTMVQEACNSKTEPKNFLGGNRAVHFIVGVSRLTPIINTIVTLILHCLQKKTVIIESSSASAQSTSAPKPSLKDRVKPNLQSQSKESKKPTKEEPLPFQLSSVKPKVPSSDSKPKPVAKIDPNLKKDPIANAGKIGKLPFPLIRATASFLPVEDLISLSKTGIHMHGVIPQSMIKAAKAADDKILEASGKAFLRAIDLMFSDRSLEDHIGTPCRPCSEEELTQRHTELLEVLKKIDKRHLNEFTYYRDGMMTRSATLLDQAIININNRERRLEIVKLLLAMGVDPEVEGFYYVKITPLAEAIKTKDQELVALLKDAIKAKAAKAPVDKAERSNKKKDEAKRA